MTTGTGQAGTAQFGTVLLLGGAGLVGTQVCRELCQVFGPQRIVVASLFKSEAEEAIVALAKEHPTTEFVAEGGNVFVPTALAFVPPWTLGESEGTRRTVLDAIYGPFEGAYADNHMVALIRAHRPEVIVDCVNTATGISYQNVSDGAIKVRDHQDHGTLTGEAGARDLDTLLMSQSNPQLVRHVLFLYRATREVGTRFYIKVGTTGTGGMGLNIPYTHGEDKPSPTLMAKNAVGFAHSGLLFLMARTPDAPIVKEIKPAAMIGYRAVRYRAVNRKGEEAQLFEPRRQVLTTAMTAGPYEPLRTREPDNRYVHRGRLETSVVDTGENGMFTRGEFAAITAMGQMEAVTPEEVAHAVILELRGANSGKDIISALDGAVMGPTYRAGLLRQVALKDLAELERLKEDHSVALGQLGPPELSKLLFEVYLLQKTFGPHKADILEEAVDRDERSRPRDPARMAEDVAQFLDTPAGAEIARRAVSVGVPILLPDGATLLRGPRLNIPQSVGNRTDFEVTSMSEVDAWAKKGWVDLRASNMQRWRDRFVRMAETREQVFLEGTAAVNIKTYLGADSFEIGNAVAWIFNNEMDGYRIK